MENGDLSPSRMSRWETAAAIGWLPVHSLILPLLLAYLLPGIGGVTLNFLLYAAGAAALTVQCFGFLRRDFRSLCGRQGKVLRTVAAAYGAVLLCNLLVSLLLGLLLPEENPNNAAVMELAARDWGKVAVMTVLLAPLVEELMFRGGFFGLLSRRSRILAYGASMLLFSVYHTWPYALEDPRNWLYLLQYLPASFALCRCYEKTESIWSSILFHILNNGVSLLALHLMGG